MSEITGSRALDTAGRVLADLPDIMTIEEVATYLAVSKATVYGWRKEDKAPPAVKFGKHLRFPKVRLVEWLDALSE